MRTESARVAGTNVVAHAAAKGSVIASSVEARTDRRRVVMTWFDSNPRARREIVDHSGGSPSSARSLVHVPCGLDRSGSCPGPHASRHWRRSTAAQGGGIGGYGGANVVSACDD